MTNEETIKLKMQREQHEHEIRKALIEAFAKDPELKYYVGVAVGAGVAGISALFGEVAGGGSTGGTTTDKGIPGWGWLGAQAVAGPAGLAYTALSDWLMDPKNPGPSDMTGTVQGILTMGGMGFSGFCAAVLLLKAVSGKEGIGGIASLVAGAV